MPCALPAWATGGQQWSVCLDREGKPAAAAVYWQDCGQVHQPPGAQAYDLRQLLCKESMQAGRWLQRLKTLSMPCSLGLVQPGSVLNAGGVSVDPAWCTRRCKKHLAWRPHRGWWPVPAHAALCGCSAAKHLPSELTCHTGPSLDRVRNCCLLLRSTKMPDMHPKRAHCMQMPPFCIRMMVYGCSQSTHIWTAQVDSMSLNSMHEAWHTKTR